MATEVVRLESVYNPGVDPQWTINDVDRIAYLDGVGAEARAADDDFLQKWEFADTFSTFTEITQLELTIQSSVEDTSAKPEDVFLYADGSSLGAKTNNPGTEGNLSTQVLTWTGTWTGTERFQVGFDAGTMTGANNPYLVNVVTLEITGTVSSGLITITPTRGDTSFEQTTGTITTPVYGTGNYILDDPNNMLATRFGPIAIDYAELIFNATLTVSTAGLVTGSGTIYFEDADTSASYTSSSGDLSGRTVTTAGDVHFLASSVANQMDVTEHVQEVVSRVGWVSGGYMSPIFKGTSPDTLDLKIAMNTAWILEITIGDGTGGPTGSPWYYFAQQGGM